jgi:hypothetical protein
MPGYGKSYQVYKAAGVCTDCKQPLKATQMVRRKYGDVAGQYSLCHEDCKAAAVPVPPSYGTTFYPDYDGKGTCAACHLPVRAMQGARYRYDNNNGTKVLVHLDCKTAVAVQEAAVNVKAQEAEAYPYYMGGGSGYGYRGWVVGEVVRGKRPEHPAFLYVCKVGSDYYREDGMSFGVGDESGRVYWARCREATAEEAGPLIAVEQRQARIKAIEVRVKEIEGLIWSGVYPEGTDNIPEGVKVFDTANIYGSGEWFVVGETRVWHVRNNGMDGDDWSHNNVRTGGAGGIGHYIDDAGIGQELLALRDEAFILGGK